MGSRTGSASSSSLLPLLSSTRRAKLKRYCKSLPSSSAQRAQKTFCEGSLKLVLTQHAKAGGKYASDGYSHFLAKTADDFDDLVDGLWIHGNDFHLAHVHLLLVELLGCQVG